jgi:hypothetical protein
MLTPRASLAGVMAALLAPLLAYGQAPLAPRPGFGYVGESIEVLLEFIEVFLVPLIFALAFLLFLWGMFKYFFWNTEEGKEQGRQLILWGVIAFVVMFSIWGIVNLLVYGFGLNDPLPPDMPGVIIPGS